jgi:hypothetical protein
MHTYKNRIVSLQEKTWKHGLNTMQKGYLYDCNVRRFTAMLVYLTLKQSGFMSYNIKKIADSE